MQSRIAALLLCLLVASTAFYPLSSAQSSSTCIGLLGGQSQSIACPAGQIIASISGSAGSFGLSCVGGTATATCTAPACNQSSSCILFANMTNCVGTAPPAATGIWIWQYTCASSPPPTPTSPSGQWLFLNEGQFASVADTGPLYPTTSGFTVAFLLGVDATNSSLPAGLVGRADGLWAVAVDVDWSLLVYLNGARWDTDYYLFHPAAAHADPIPNIWHVAVTYVHSPLPTTRLYVNSYLLSSRTWSSPLSLPPPPSQVTLAAKFSPLVPYGFNGYYDELVVYARPLSVAEIGTLMTSPATPPATPAGWWRLDGDLTGTPASLAFSYPGLDGGAFSLSPLRTVLDASTSSAVAQQILLSAADADTADGFLSRNVLSLPAQFILRQNALNDAATTITAVPYTLVNDRTRVTYTYAASSTLNPECPFDFVRYSVSGPGGQYSSPAAFYVASHRPYNFANPVAASFLQPVAEDSSGTTIALRASDPDYSNALRFGDADSTDAGSVTLTGSLASASGNWSASFWFSPGRALPPTPVTIAAQCSTPAWSLVLLPSGQLSFSLNGTQYNTTTYSLAHDKWYFVSLGRENALTNRVYVNGAAPFTGVAAPAVLSAGSYTLHLGRSCAAQPAPYGLKVHDAVVDLLAPSTAIRRSTQVAPTALAAPLNEGRGVPAATGTVGSPSLAASGVYSWRPRDEPSCQVRRLQVNITAAPSRGVLYQTADGYTKGAAITTGVVSDSLHRVIYDIADTNLVGVVDWFLYVVTDEAGAVSSAGNVTINATSTADFPSASDVWVQGVESVCLAVNLSVAKPDPLPDIVAVVPQSPYFGQLFADAACSTAVAAYPLNVTSAPYTVYYRGAPNGYGSVYDSFLFYAMDSAGRTSPYAIVRVNLTAVITPPTAGNVWVTVEQNTNRIFQLIGADPENGDPVTYTWTVLPAPANGNISSLALSSPVVAAVAYSSPDYSIRAGSLLGSFVANYYVSSPSGVSAVATVNFTVVPFNVAPAAFNLTVDCSENVPSDAFNLSATDPDSAVLQFRIGIPPAFGTLNNSLSTGNFTSGLNLVYTPQQYFYGSDFFSYQAFDGLKYSDWVFCTIKVAQDPSLTTCIVPPTINLTTLEDTLVSFNVSVFYTGNAAWNDNSAELAYGTPAPISGSTNPFLPVGCFPGFSCPNQVLGPANPFSLAYTPAPNFFGSTAFTIDFFYLTNLLIYDSCSTTVNVNVLSVFDNPSCLATSGFAGTTYSLVPFSTAPSSVETGHQLRTNIVSVPTGCTLYTGNVSTNQVVAVSNLPYLAPVDSNQFALYCTASGSQLVGYEAVDVTAFPNLFSPQCFVDVTVKNKVNGPTAIPQFNLPTLQDQPLSFNLSYTAGSNFVNTATVNLTNLAGTLSVGASCTSNVSGAFSATSLLTYCPPAFAHSPPYPFTSFAFFVTDTVGLNSSPAPVTINVVAVDDKPSALAVAVSATEKSITAVDLRGVNPDRSADVLIGSLEYLPPASEGVFYYDALATRPIPAGSPTPLRIYFRADNYPICPGTNGPSCAANVTTNYRLTDPYTSLVSDPAQLRVEVTSVDDPPVAVSTAYDVNQSSTNWPITLTGSDPDDVSLQVVVDVLPTGTLRTAALASVVVGVPFSPLAVRYTPPVGAVGSPFTSFTFRLLDPLGASSAPAVATINVIEQDFPPTAVSFSTACDQSSVCEIQLQGSDDHTPYASLRGEIRSYGTGRLYQLDGSPITATPAAVAYSLTVLFEPDGNLSSSFTYVLIDERNQVSGIAVVQINVSAVVQVPVAFDTAVQTTEDTPLQIFPSAAVLFGPNTSYAVFVSQWPTDVGTFSLDFPPTAPNNFTGATVPQSLAPGNSFYYTPRPDYFGSFFVKFYAVNVLGNVSNDGYINVTVTPSNDPYYAIDLSLFSSENQVLPVRLQLYSPDIPGVPTATPSDVQFTVTTAPSQGALWTTVDGFAPTAPITALPYSLTTGDDAVVYVPNVDWVGTDSFAYTAQRTGYATTPNASVTINTTSAVFAPIAFGANVYMDELVSLTANITLSGSPAPGATLYGCISEGLFDISSINPAEGLGTLYLLPSLQPISVGAGECVNLTGSGLNKVQYIAPVTNYPQDGRPFAAFRWRWCNTLVTDTSPYLTLPQCSQEAIVRVFIKGVNDPPVAFDQYLTLYEDEKYFWIPNASDVDSGTPGSLIFTVPDNSTGALYQNDIADSLSEQIFTSPNGTLVRNRAVYVPPLNANNFNGNWSYRAVDRLDSSMTSALRWVYFTVLPVNDPPIAENFSSTVTATRPATVSFAFHASDEENDPLSYYLIGLPDSGTVFDMSTPDGVRVPCACSPCSNCSIPPWRIQAPNATIQFRASLTNVTTSPFATILWYAFDGTNRSYVGVLSIDLVRNLSPAAVGGTYYTLEDTNVTLALNGTDPEGDPLTTFITQLPRRGSLYQWSGQPITDSSALPNEPGPRVTDSLGRVVFVPVPDDNSATIVINNVTTLTAYTSISYVVRDIDGALSNTALVNIVVQPVEDMPRALNITVSVREEDSKLLVLDGSDPEGDPLTFFLLSIPTQGFVYPTLNGITPIDSSLPIRDSDLPYRFPSSTAQLIYDAPRVDGTDDLYQSLSYVVRVMNGGNSTTYNQTSPVTWITIIVIPSNDPPVANDITIYMIEDGNATILLSGFDLDTTDRPYPIIVELPELGSLYQYPNSTVNITVDSLDRIVTPFSDVIDPAGASGVPNTWRVIYIPPANAFGMPFVSFSYILTDGQADSGNARVTVYVEGVNDSPSAAVPLSQRALLGSDMVINIGGLDLETGGPIPLQGFIVSIDGSFSETGSQLFQYFDKGLNKQRRGQLNFTSETTRGELITQNCTPCTDPERRVILNPQLDRSQKRESVKFSVQFFDGELWSPVGDIQVLIQRPKSELPADYRGTTGNIVAPIIGAAAAVVSLLIVIGIIWYRNTRVGDDEDYINMFRDTEEDKALLAGGDDDDDDDDGGGGAFKGTDLEQLILDEKYEVVNALLAAMDVTEYDALAKALIDISEFHGKTLHMLKYLITQEVDGAMSAGTLFRANSIASKMMTAYTKMIGNEYLVVTLKTPIDTILKKDNAMEVDPKKLKAGESRKANMRLLQLACQNFTDWIITSYNNAPLPFKVLANHLAVTVEKKFPQSKHTAVGGFLFLRFFCPAIISPEGFKIVAQPPPPTARRALVLVAKALQNLSNGVEFGKKEEYMIDLNEFIRRNMEPLKSYFDSMVNLPSTSLKVAPHEVPLDRETASLNVVHRYLYEFRAKIVDVLEGKDGTHSESTHSHSTSRSGRSRGTAGTSVRGTTTTGSRSSKGTSRRGSSKGSRLSQSSRHSQGSRTGSLRQPAFGEESATDVSNSSDDGDIDGALDNQIFVGDDGIEYVPTEGELSEDDEILYDDDVSENAFSVEEVGTETARALGLPVNDWTNVDDLSLDAEWEKHVIVAQDQTRPGFGPNGEIVDPVAALNYVLDSMPPPE